MNSTAQAGAATTAPAAGRRVTPTGRLILSADADRDAWLTARRNGIGSSDLAAVLGISRYGNALSVWHDKTGGLPLEGDDSEPALWGRAIEDTVAREWARRNRSAVRRVGLVANVDRPWQMCTLDRRVLVCPLSSETRERCAVEIKCRAAFKAGQWRTGCPDDVLAQVLWQIDVCGFDHLHVGTLIGGNDYRQFVVRRADHEPLIADLRAAGQRAWEQITTRRPPVLPESADPDVLMDLYEQLHPNRSGEPVAIDRDGDAQDALADYLEAGNDERDAKARKKTAKAKLIGALGSADTALLGGRTAYSYDEETREYVDRERLREEFPAAYAACVEDRSSRRINIPHTVREAHQV
ncbi:YqaJ viral recombinase family protein [Streptomyces flavidovirens]|uniref:YqaJ viral recombinase family nuclease n=1 Tax=Streptomyces flavidovirens TaxID=67298 RepID=UPI0003FC2FCC|nr:YqaJ viral recombinase family protein [Streptomyces flavidovirens]